MGQWARNSFNYYSCPCVGTICLISRRPVSRYLFFLFVMTFYEIVFALYFVISSYSNLMIEQSDIIGVYLQYHLN